MGPNSPRRYSIHGPISEGSWISFDPENPTENAFIKGFNGRLRDECPNVFDFVSLEDAQTRIEHWRQDYNHPRPHGALKKLTPTEFVRRGQVTTSEVPELRFFKCLENRGDVMKD